MQTKIMVSAVLLLLGFALPAWASPRPQPAPPVQETGAPPTPEARHKPLTPPVPPRGQLLYENHCMSCHESVVHVRTRQHARSLPQLRTKVRHWAAYLRLRWDQEEVEEVVRHLNSQYYKFESR